MDTKTKGTVKILGALLFGFAVGFTIVKYFILN